MAKLTPDQFAEKLARRLKAAIPDMQAGIQAVSEAPTAKAAAKKEKMKSRLVAKIDDGTWENRLKAVSLEEWKKKAAEIGTQRVAAGIDAATDKVKRFAEQLLPYQESLKAQVDKMPDLTLEDSINRMTTWVRGMAKFRKK
ncbi:MAG: hypothetical protein H5U03_00200 [Clostridia bacterium]|nr:hypothetical protein [Clostridia bacterium]